MPFVGTLNAGFQAGRKVGTSTSPIFNFFSFTFNSANVVGRTGPSLNQLLANYNTVANPWLLNSNYFSTSTVNPGVQYWTVPSDGVYRITAKGAQGSNPNGNGGNGAVMQGDFNLVKGDRYMILVGQVAPNTGHEDIESSGGGASWVVKYSGTTSTIAELLLVAGGGGGTNSDTPSTAHASISTTGNPGTLLGGGSGGVGGNGGTQGNGGSTGAGGGFLTDGYSDVGITTNGGGKSFISGGLGGEINSTYAVNGGGFGGGGSTTNGPYGRCGGGGGYSGGGGSALGLNGVAEAGLAGGGGGSYNVGANQVNLTGAVSGNTGSGVVTIVLL
jgi:hypothetical protein